jgi:hypothetical protein
MNRMTDITSHDFFTRFRNGESGYEQRDSDGTEVDASGRAHRETANGYGGGFGQVARAGKPGGDVVGMVSQACQAGRGDRQHNTEIHHRRRVYGSGRRASLVTRQARALEHSANGVYWSGLVFMLGSAAAVAVGVAIKLIGV